MSYMAWFRCIYAVQDYLLAIIDCGFGSYALLGGRDDEFEFPAADFYLAYGEPSHGKMHSGMAILGRSSLRCSR